MADRTMARPCDICGDPGVFEAIITCCECKTARQHLYCMKVFRMEAPQFWCCDECDENKKSFTPKQSQKADPPSQKVSSFMHRGTRGAGGGNKKRYASRLHFKEQKVETGKTKYISCEEAATLSSGSKISDYPYTIRPNSATGPSKSLPPRIVSSKPVSKEKPTFHKMVQKAKNAALSPRNGAGDERTIKAPKSFERVKTNNSRKETEMAKSAVLPPGHKEADVGLETSTGKDTKIGAKNRIEMETGSPDADKPNLRNDLPAGETRFSFTPALYPCWKGIFTLPAGNGNLNDEFKAHPPSTVHNKVYETLRKMPKSIDFVLISRNRIWADIFPDHRPGKDDIGLYFFPISRSEGHVSIVDLLWSENLVMRSHVEGVELLVLSSRLLQPDSQRFEGNYFLWGVFRRRRHAAAVPSAAPTVVHHGGKENGEAVDMDIDARPPSGVKPEPCDDVPPGFERIAGPPLDSNVNL